MDESAGSSLPLSRKDKDVKKMRRSSQSRANDAADSDFERDTNTLVDMQASKGATGKVEESDEKEGDITLEDMV